METPEPDGYVRLYLDEGAPMLALLQHAAGTASRRPARGRPADSSNELDRLGAEPLQPLADPLSQRELEVLRLLDSELSGPEIAGQLYVSLNTLRTHTKRIFTKLDVKDPGGRRTPGPRTRGALTGCVPVHCASVAG